MCFNSDLYAHVIHLEMQYGLFKSMRLARRYMASAKLVVPKRDAFNIAYLRKACQEAMSGSDDVALTDQQHRALKEAYRLLLFTAYEKHQFAYICSKGK